MVYLPADASDPSALPAPSRAAFAISRKVGNAVKRNQLRRRLRTILRDAEHPPEGEHGLAPGTYLVTARPSVTDLSYQALSQLVGSACAEVARSREGGR